MMYNDDREKWWIPFQSLWRLDNDEWMAERRRLWKIIRQSIDPDGDECVHEMRGMRNFFLTGHVFTEKPPFPDLDGVEGKMRVNDCDRMLLAPFEEVQHYQQFLQAILAQNPNHNILAHIMDPFLKLGSIHKNTGLADEKCQQIYQFLLGGGAFSDNTVLLAHERAMKAYSPAHRLHSYFFSLAIVLKLKGRENGQGRGRFLIPLFDYYTSMAEHPSVSEIGYTSVAENPSLSERERERKERVLPGYREHFQMVFKQYKHPTPIDEPWAKELYEKSCDFLYGDRLPRILYDD